MHASPLARVQENTVASGSPTSSLLKTPHEASELTSPSAAPTRESHRRSSSSCATPPDLHAIQDFMVQYSAIASPSADGRPPPPYKFTGCDYALVLHACFPNKCIDLSSLSWSSAPLASQLTGNLECFCTAARQLALVETPFSALQPHLLQPLAGNVLHHLTVQHWLFVASRRFPPSPLYDALAMRVLLRHQQLGVPTLKRTRSALEGGGVVVTVANTEDGACPSLRHLAPFTLAQLAPCTPYVSAVPPFTTRSSASQDELADADGAKPPMRGPPSPRPATEGDRPKPWLSYSKPWRLPALEAAKAKKEAEEAAATRRAQARQARDPSHSAFAASSRSLQEQCELSCDATRQFQRQLREIHGTQMACLVRTGALDFAVALAALEQAGIIPPTPRSTE